MITMVDDEELAAKAKTVRQDRTITAPQQRTG
jgi:hypothetical protein